MKRLTLTVCIFTIFLFLMPAVASASPLVFAFLNPSFGGSPFNGQWMLAQAEAQNKHIEKTKPFKMPKRDPVTDFKESLNRQILYKLSSRIVNAAFGEEGLEPGHYDLDDYTINIMTSPLDGIRLTITDKLGGGQTIIEVPYY